jgi:predicted  nucleic acid-binding Zn-ribbon protein
LPTQIELLAALQEVDLSLSENTKAVADGQARVAALDETLGAREAELEAAKRTLAEHEGRRRELEERVAELETKLKDRRMRIARIRNERELAVVRHEVEVLKEEASAHETELLELFDRIEAARQACDGAKAARDAVAVERTEAVAALDATVAEVRDAIARDEARRGELAGHVDDELHRRYRMIFERRGGVAVVPVRDGICQGCHMNVPPQLYNQVLRNEQVLLCPSCQRIMFWRAAEIRE